ncbi:MAG: aminotransferase class V-fold PLP-dependent enzyme [Balneolaceae bacterium]
MKKEILQLQEETARLDPTRRERKKIEKAATAYTEQFLESLSGQKAYRTFDSSINELLEDPIREEPAAVEKVIRQIGDRIIPPGINASSGAHMGYIPGGGLVASAVADYIAAVTNPYAGVYASAPGAVCIETRLIRWMSELLGYPATAGGNLSSGGSIANLTAIVTAREAAGIRSSDVPDQVVYLTRQTHHCVDRALNIAGLGELVRRYVPTDYRLRMKPGVLREMVETDRADGLTPWLVVGSAGTTNTGAVDPLEAIGEIAEEQKIWFHVDAAYGGFFLLTEAGKRKLKGIELSDSAVLDPHKGLFIPYGLGALVVRDVEKLAYAHRFQADYMLDSKSDHGIYSPADLSPELSKHFRGLRLWLPLKLHGVQAFRSALKEKLLLARYAWQQLDKMEDVEVSPEPELSIFMFRYKPSDGNADTDKLNQQLHQAIIRDGRVFVSTTRHNGHFMFRLAILSFRTHLEQVDLFLSLFREKISELTEGRTKKK